MGEYEEVKPEYEKDDPMKESVDSLLSRGNRSGEYGDTLKYLVFINI